MKNKKADMHSRFNRSYDGEYGGIYFTIKREKMRNQEFNKLKRQGKKPKSKVVYNYYDSDVGCRQLNKELYKNIIKNSEVLYDNIKQKSIR